MEIIIQDLKGILDKRNISLDNLSDVSKEILSTAQNLEGCWIAGGAPLAIYMNKFNHIKDWDLFFDSDSSRKQAIEVFKDIGFEETYVSDWSISYKKLGEMVQFITMDNYSKVEDIFKEFDLSVCCFAIEENHICYTYQAKYDVDNMVMNFITTKSPVIFLKRIARYGAKGFKLTTSAVVKFLQRLDQLNIDVNNIATSEGISNNTSSSVNAYSPLIIGRSAQQGES